jgi:hypothetical protein
MADQSDEDLSGSEKELIRKARPKSDWKDPACAKCGIVLGNRMMYLCPHQFCPAGLN